MRRVTSIFVASVTVATAAPPNFDDHILPIFENACTNCHNPDKQKGDLDLTNYTAMLRGGSGGKIAVPGEGADSKIYGVITHTLKPKMPPKGDKLAKKDAELIRAWIDGGLLENKSGKPKKKPKPSFALKVAPSAGKPEGPPPMPEHLLLEPVVETARASAVLDMAASPWAPLLAVTGQRQVLLYHTETLSLEGILPFDRGQPASLSFHPSGKYLLAGGGTGGKSGTTVVWDVPSGKPMLTAGKEYDTVLAASLRADLGGVALGGPGKRVKLWQTGTGEPLASLKKHTDWITQLAYSPDGVLLASGGRGGGVYVWEADTGNEFYNLRGHQASITGLAWRSDSNLLASASEDGSVLVWNMRNGKQVKKIPAHGGGVLALDWNKHGGGQLVTSGRDRKVKTWKPDFNLARELPPFSTLVTEVAVSHDGKRVFAADLAGRITVWEAASGKQVGTLSANPPAIATRIKHIRERLASLPAKVAELEKKLPQAEAARATARAKLEAAEKTRREAEAKHKQLAARRTELDARVKAADAKVAELAKTRGQHHKTLQKARRELEAHNAALAAAGQQLQAAEAMAAELDNKEKRLVANEERARKAAAARPEDNAAREAAAKAKSALDLHREKRAQHQNTVSQRAAAVARLTQQQKAPGDRLAEAERLWKGTSRKWESLDADRKALHNQRGALEQPVKVAREQAKAAEKNILPARERLTAAEGAVKKSRAELELTRRRLAGERKNLRRWQAAAINTEAIQLAEAAKKAVEKQHAAMEAFTALAREIGRLEDPAELAEKTARLNELRAGIDRAAPAVLEQSRRAQSRRQAYLKALE